MRKLMLIALFSSLVVSCNESMQNDGSNSGNGDGTAQSHSSLTCLSFTDSAIEAYAKSNWDGDNDGCVSKDEAAAVTSIPANAFAGNTSIASLDDLKQLPNLTSIGDNAFAGCTNLKNANLSTVTSIGDSAFAGCSNLSEANMPNASDVADNAFDGTRVHQSVTCPAACPDDCDANGVCNLHVVCPADCPDDCDADGVCNVHVACPAACPDDCDANGVCNLHVVCPAECPNDCDADGVCNLHVACPAECPDDCDANGVCNLHVVVCPASCPDDCDADGVCNVHPVCPASCPDDCDANGVCNLHVVCPAECPNDCDANGVCNVHSVGAKDICVFGKAYRYSEADHRYDDGVACPNGCDSRGKACRSVDHNDGDKMCIGEMAYTWSGGSWGSGRSCANGCDGDDCRTNLSCEGSGFVSCVDGYAYTCADGSLTKKACSGKEYCTADKCDNSVNGYLDIDLKEHLNLLAEDTECNSFGNTRGNCFDRNYIDEDYRDNKETYVTETCLPPFASQSSYFDRNKLYWQVTSAVECKGRCIDGIGCMDWDLEKNDDCSCTPENDGILKEYCEDYVITEWVDDGAWGYQVQKEKHDIFARRCVCKGEDCRWFADHNADSETDSGSGKCPSTYADGVVCGGKKHEYYYDGWCSDVHYDELLEDPDDVRVRNEAKTRDDCYDFGDGDSPLCYYYTCDCVDDSSAEIGFSCAPHYAGTTKP